MLSGAGHVKLTFLNSLSPSFPQCTHNYITMVSNESKQSM
jgi:hypothetical protein